MRRSGFAVCMCCWYLDDWRPDTIVQVGVGILHKELDVLTKVWPHAKLIGFEPNPDTYKSIKEQYPGELINKAIITHEVDMITLDSVSEITYGNTLLWIDVEGAEFIVLQGAEKFIEAVDIVNVELTADSNIKGACKPEQVHQWLINHEFVRQHVHSSRTSIGQYDAIYVRRELFKPQRCNDPEQFWSLGKC
jgi:hypothetical protein